MPILLIIITIVSSLLVGSGIGWTVKDWKDGAKMATLESRVAVADAANDKCAADVESARAGVKQITDALETKKREAKAAMNLAQVSAQKHSDLAAEIRNGPNRPGESQCDAIIREQKEYVQSRAQP